MNFFDVNNVFFNIGSYPLSYIEFIGTVCYFLSVWLMSRKHMLTWPIGIVSVVLFGILFYQFQLYADTIEQVYYLVISLYGWWMWLQVGKHDSATEILNTSDNIITSWSSSKQIAIELVFITIASIAFGYCVSNFHVWMPNFFSVPADYPWLDALTTVTSFVAMYLLTKRKNEAWVYWIIVDVIAIGLYWVKDIKFISIQYVFLTAMAGYGLYVWMQKTEKNATN